MSKTDLPENTAKIQNQMPLLKKMKTPRRRKGGDAAGCNRADKLGARSSAVPVCARCPVRMDEQAKERSKTKQIEKIQSAHFQQPAGQRERLILRSGDALGEKMEGGDAFRIPARTTRSESTKQERRRYHACVQCLASNASTLSCIKSTWVEGATKGCFE